MAQTGHGVGHVRRVIRPALRGHLARPTQLPVGRAGTDSTAKLRTTNCEAQTGNWKLATHVTPLGDQRAAHLSAPLLTCLGCQQLG